MADAFDFQPAPQEEAFQFSPAESAPVAPQQDAPIAGFTSGGAVPVQDNLPAVPTTDNSSVGDLIEDAIGSGVRGVKDKAQSVDQFRQDMKAQYPTAYQGLSAVGSGALGILHGIGNAFGAVTGMLLSPINRLASGATDDQGFTSGYLNPAYIQKMRERNGLPGDYNQAWDQVSKQGPWAQAKFIAHEAVPYDAEAADQGIAAKQINDTVDALNIQDPDVKNLTRAMARLSWNIGSDPLMLDAGLSAMKQPEAVVGAAKAGGTVTEQAKANIDAAVEMMKSSDPASASWEQMARDKGLVKLKMPLTGIEIPSGDSSQFAAKLDDISSWMSAKTPIRNFSQTTGMETADGLSRMWEMGKASNQADSEGLKDYLMSNPIAKDYNALEYASTLAQHGEEWGPKVYDKINGSPLSDVQKMEAANFADHISSQYDAARDYVKDSTGIEIPDKPAQSGNVPLLPGNDAKYLLKDGDKTYDYRYATNYGFGRAAQDQVLAMNDAAREGGQVATSMGLQTSASSLKNRVALSDQAAEEFFANKYGVPYFFNKNLPDVVYRKITELHQFANDMGYVKSMKDAYGIKKEGIQDFIDAAASRVEAARNNGEAPMMEDMTIAKMGPSDFKPVNPRVFDTMKYVSNGSDDIDRLIPQDLHYPKQVANRINSMFAIPSEQNSVMKTALWFQGLLAKNQLTNPLRFGRMAWDGIVRSAMAGANPLVGVPREMAIALKEAVTGNPSVISKEMELIPSMKENILNFEDTKGPFKLNSSIMKDSDINGLPQAYVDAIHNTSSSNNLGRLAKSAAEFPTDNPISKFFRSVGNAGIVAAKRATYRELRASGYNPIDATEAVAKSFMDFTRTDNAVRYSQLVNPWASMQFKNMETLMGLAMNNKLSMNVLNTDHGYLKRFFEDAGGWNPKAARDLQEAIPMIHDGAMSYVLRGQKDLAADSSPFRKFMTQMYLGSLPDDQQQQFLKNGAPVNIRLYDPVEGAMNFLDPEKSNQNYYAPLVSAAIMRVAGYDTFKGMNIKEMGTTDEENAKLAGTLDRLNPASYPAAMGIMRAGAQKAGIFANKLFSDPLDDSTKEKLKLMKDPSFQDILRNDPATGRVMSQAPFIGLARPSAVDETFMWTQYGLMEKFKRSESLLTSVINKPGANQAGANIDRARNIALEMKDLGLKIRQNSKAFMEWRKLRDATGQREVTPSFKFDPAEPTGNVKVESDPHAPFTFQPADVQDRKPQSIYGGQTGNMLMDAASDKIAEKLIPTAQAQADVQTAPVGSDEPSMDQAEVPEEDTQTMQFQDLPGPPLAQNREPQSKRKR